MLPQSLRQPLKSSESKDSVRHTILSPDRDLRVRCYPEPEPFSDERLYASSTGLNALSLSRLNCKSWFPIHAAAQFKRCGFIGQEERGTSQPGGIISPGYLKARALGGRRNVTFSEPRPYSMGAEIRASYSNPRPSTTFAITRT